MNEPEYQDVMRRSEYAGMTREKLTAGIVHDLVELPNEALVLLRGLVAEMVAAERQRGTARRIDGPALAEEQRAREDASGLAAVMGRWPGDESDEQIAAALRGQ